MECSAYQCYTAIMLSRVIGCVLTVLVCVLPAQAQLSQNARYSILGQLIATEGAARVPMPLGKNGLELSDLGLVDRTKLQKELSSNGSAIAAGKVVRITAIEFGDKEIEFEIDGGGTVKKGILSRVQIGVGMGGGGTSQQQQQPERQAKGSKVTLKFANKIPPDTTPDQLKDLLNPILDFTKQTMVSAGVEALPPEFKDAVIAKEARVGMDSNTVLLALGRPNRRNTEKNAEGIEQEDWIYTGRGARQTLVTFEKGIVVSVREY
jgi:hypothetical protein